MRVLHRAQVHVLFAVLASAVFATEARANFQVAYINATGGSVDYLSSYGIDVTYLNNPTGLTLAQLAPYDAILISPNSAFTEATNIGNVAADFADSGRGVVLTAFDLFGLGGKIMTPSYSPLNLTNTGNLLNTATLTTVFDPGNPILSGVDPSQVVAKYNVAAGLNSGATLVADWGATSVTSSRHAVAYTTLDNSSVVFLNLFPSSGAVGVDSGITSESSLRMVANALKFSAADPSPSDAVAAPAPSGLALAAVGGACLLGTGWRQRRRGDLAVRGRSGPTPA